MRGFTTALITGITGFVGSYMAKYITENQNYIKLYGIHRWRSPTNNLTRIKSKENLELLEADLKDIGSLIRVLQKTLPDVIFHFAAQSYVQTSFNSPIDTLHTNIIGTANLLEAIRITNIHPVIVTVSSSEVYGQVLPEEVPIKETNQFRPASPYAVGKVGEDMIAYNYFLSFGLRTIRTRMFSHTGPGRGQVFFESSVARQIALIEAGKQDNKIKVGNLDSIRTFADVRDAVHAYWLTATLGDIGEVYNIGGNRTMPVRECLKYLLSLSPVGDEIEVVQDYDLMRPSDVTLQIPDISKFTAKTNWQPFYTFEQTMQDLLNFWRQEV
jgi:GDP-mannose 4,6-dehydratase